MNLCFAKFLHILTSIFNDHAPIKKLSKKEKSLIDKPWIDNYLRHLMAVRDACCIKYCRAKKATEKLKIHAEYKVLRNEVISRIYLKKIKQIYQKLGSSSIQLEWGGSGGIGTFWLKIVHKELL